MSENVNNLPRNVSPLTLEKARMTCKMRKEEDIKCEQFLNYRILVIINSLTGFINGSFSSF